MRAVRLHTQAPIADAPLELEDCPEPQPGPADVRIRVTACGACHTDLHIVEGDLPLKRSPLILGHQIVGVVESVGEYVDRERVGKRVGVPWMSASCNDCRACRNGRENLCAQASFTGYDVDGGFAELAVVPSSAAHTLPESINDVEAAPLLCAGIIGYRSLRRAELQPGQTLGLFGFGASAHLAIQVARHWGCDVFVFTRSEEHRELARSLGAAWAGGTGDKAPAPLDAAVTFAPVATVVGAAMGCLAPGGTLAVNAIHLAGAIELDYGEHLCGERTLRSVTNLTHRDAEEFLMLAAEVPVTTTVEEFGLDEANVALMKMKASTLAAAAVIVP